MINTFDLSGALRTAIIANSDVTNHIDTYLNEPAVVAHERVPGNLPARFVYISENTGSMMRDGIRTHSPILLRQISVYGDQPADTKDIDLAAFALTRQFHRQKNALTISGFSVMNITATYPMIAPVSDDQKVGRVVALQIWLRQITPAF